METQPEVEAPAPPSPAAPQVHEKVLKARRFAERFTHKGTEAVIIVHAGGFDMLDMQVPGKFQLTSNPINERWREVLRKPVEPKKTVAETAAADPKPPKKS